jgi:ParB family chromosome partitioning protein
MSMFDTQTVEIPVDEIRTGANIKNIRTDFPTEGIEQLAESILRDGLMQPLVVMPSEFEGVQITELIAGERRLRAIRLLQGRDPSFMASGIPCMMFEGSLHEAKYLNAIENVERENIDDVDLSAWIHMRVNVEGVGQTELAEKLHRSPSWVNFRIVFHEKAVDMLKQAVRDQLISFTAAYHLAKNHSQEDQIAWVKKAIALGGKISVEDAVSKKKADDTEAGVKAPSKKARAKMLERAQKVADDSGSELARGMSLALRWVDVLEMTDEDISSFLEIEASK